MRYVNSIRGMLIFYDPRLSGMTLIVTVLCVPRDVLLRPHHRDASREIFPP